MFILDDYDIDLDFWFWWGEFIYWNGQYVGKIISSVYSYSLECYVCLGFVYNFFEDMGEEQVVIVDFINWGEYEIDIVGYCFQVKVKFYFVVFFFIQKC